MSNNKQPATIYEPMPKVQPGSRRIFPFFKASFANWIISILNGLVRMQVGKGLQLLKAEGGWRIQLTNQSDLSQAAYQWLPACLESGETKTQVWVKLPIEGFYYDNAGNPNPNSKYATNPFTATAP